MQTFIQDLRYGARMLLKKPGFTIVAVITLALGIGANSAIFSVVNSLLLRPLPYRDSERLAIIWTHSPGANVAQDWPSPGQFSAIKSHNTVFEELALALGEGVSITGMTEPEIVGAVRTSSVMFSLLGAQPTLGRAFLPEEDTPDKAPTVILNWGFWQRRFGGDSKAIGRSIMIDGRSHTIVGVMSAGFSLDHEVMPTVSSISHADILLPLPLSAERMSNQGDENYNVLARLKPGATIAQAQAELNLATRRLERERPDSYPASRRFSFSVRPLLEQTVGDVRLPLLILLGAVGCVLLIACANVANLLLARAATRAPEMAIRAALGAGRWRIVRQLLTESLLLATVGGALGLLLAVWLLAGLRWLNPGNIPRMQTISVDGWALAFTFVVAVGAGVLFGLAPALRGSRISLNDTLKDSGRSMAGGGHRQLRNLLVITEIALSLMLLIGAGLLVRSFIHVQHVDPGFATSNVLSLRLTTFGTESGDKSRRLTFFQQVWERVRRLPGVEAAGGVSELPLTGGVGWGTVTIEGYNAATGQSQIQADRRVASVGYFETMKIPLISGRFFTEQDTNDSEKVVIVDRKMARAYWPNTDPVGKRLKFGDANSDDPWRTIIGVVGSVKHYALDTDSRVLIYGPHRQNLFGSISMVVRTTADPLGLAAAVTREVRAIEPNAPIWDVKSMDQRLSESLARRRFSMIALGLFAGLAALLASVGIYGVMSYAVAERTREIGVRMAMGAGSRDVLSLVIGQGMRLAGAGFAFGLTGAFVLTRVMARLLFGVSATDPLTFSAIALSLAVVALAACYLPARHAAKVDPMIALRGD